MESTSKHSLRNIQKSTDMVHVLGQERRSGRQLNVITIKEKIPLPPRENILLFQGKHRARHSFSQPYLDSKYESKQSASAPKVAQCKASENDRKPQLGDRACDDNELVKHMSNLPGFLLKVEKENTIQEKALNFGVIDWKRLEKWKYTERMPGKLHKRTSSASGPPKMVPISRKQPSPHSLNSSSSYSAKQPMPNYSRFSSPQRQPPPPHSSHLNSPKEERNGTYHIEEESLECIKSKGKETCNQEYQAAESFRIGRQQDHFLQRIGSDHNYAPKKKDIEKEMTSEREASSSASKLGKHKISLESHKKIGGEGKKSEMRFDEVKLTSECLIGGEGKKSEMRFDEVKLTSECRPEDPQNFYEKNCSESSQSTEPSASLDAQLSAAAENRLSDFFSPRELYSGEFSNDIPHSCPLPSGTMEPHVLLTSQAMDTDTCIQANSLTSISSKAMNETTAHPSVLAEGSNRKQANVVEQPSAKGRSASPTRRFSFNIGKMSRSFSFKESSAPQLSSTYTSVKSGPVRPEDAPGIGNFERDQANASTRGRSSPLRRLLDPFLKPKTTSETVRPPNVTLRSMSVNNTGSKGPSQDRKPEASTSQALLQLTFKNGLPFFKLVVENNKDMLAAAVKRLLISGKSDPCMMYSFYSVHEIRKKGMNWMNHGSKSKSYSLGYNIIGQMKISNTSRLTGDTSEYDARECVLYGVDPAQGDKQILEFVHKKEIIAIVVKKSSEKINDGELRDKIPLFDGKENSDDIVVILPGGIHGTPIKGTPSSLISRWKSGGLCDCGGWDIGCKLRVLADSEKSSDIHRESISSSIDHVNLYMQGVGQKGKPVFSLKPLSNEFFSIEMDASISLLEAFATSVAYITCLRFPEIIEMKGETEVERSPEANVGTDKRNTSNVQIPAKYVTCPPLSPVGRI